MKHTNFQLLLTSALLILSSGVSADNGLVYPPADNSQIYEYPPTNFGAVPANPVIPYPSMNNATGFNQPPQFTGNRSFQNNGYQNRMPQQNGMTNSMPMKRMNPYQTNNGFPFSNNMPFGNNNSGNGFNPFSGGNMPFGNNSGNNFNPFSGNNMPFGNNSGNNFNPFSGGNLPFGSNSNNPMNNMFGNSNNNNNSMPFFGNNRDKSRKKAWGDKRNIWPDFYTDFTDDAWDTMSSGPRDLGTMPGGWRFPHISTPDPVTVSDAITNQFPPIAEEGGNMMDFSDWGVFDDK